MSWLRLLRAELRKLATTSMPWAFMAVLVAIGAVNASAVIWGSDMDGSKAFIATAADQRSLVAFAANATVIGGLCGAIAVAREYTYGTVIPTFLTEPHRYRTMLAQYTATGIGGAMIGLAGAGITVAAVALALTTTEFDVLLSAGAVARVLVAAAFSGAAGALLGAGIGATVRNTGGAVTGAVIALIVAPPLIVQLVNDAAEWVPAPLATALSGVTADAAGVEAQAGIVAATLALAAWGLVPAAIGLITVQRRDLV